MAKFVAHLLRSATAAATLAVCCGATAANAEGAFDTSRTSASWSKTSAILGGAPSALEAILAQQGGKAATSVATLRPASFSRPVIKAVQAQVRERDDATSGRPDVFGTVALGLDHTRLDGRWKRVQHASISGNARNFADGLQDDSKLARLEAVNRYVNRAVTFVDDSRQFGREDVWSTANDTLRRGRGDCEDYAIAKLQMLREAGFSGRDLYLVILKDLVRRSDHAVLVARADGHFYLLDNGTDEVTDSNDVQDYRPIVTFSADGAWTHGYRVNQRPAVSLASAETEVKAPSVLALADQRSRIASPVAFSTGFNR